jgi:hypothetical protein
MVSARLEAIWSDRKDRHTTAFVVIRHDTLSFERYAAGYSRSTQHPTG